MQHSNIGMHPHTYGNHMWKKITETSFTAGFRKMLNRTFVLPDGKRHDFDIKHEGPAVCVLPLTEGNEVVLAEQFRPGPEKVLLELPGGKLEKDENPMESIRRELLEETGYAGDFELVGTCYDCAYSTMKRYCFVARNCKKVGEPEPDDTEFINVRTVSLEKFRTILRSGMMTDVEVGYLALDHLGILNRNNPIQLTK
ncbi:MAG: NUDIX hydrolase [Patescibacteria group bacterium]|nr:NUDIX hydrolase [Patescibacteria group bacterium]